MLIKLNQERDNIMALESIRELNRNKQGGSGYKVCSNSSPIVIAITSKGNKGKRRPHLSFKIHESMMKKMRWVIGDRIDVLLDAKDRVGLLKRVSDGGYALCAASSGKQIKGSVCHGSVKVTLPDIGLYPQRSLRTTPAESVKVNDEGILFVFPDPAAKLTSVV